MAELTRTAAERYGDAMAATFLRDGEWAELTFAELWAAGARPRPRADRPRRRRRRSGRASSPTRASSSRSPTSPRRRSGRSSCRCTRRTRPTSASGCVGDSGAKVIVCENAAQVAKIDEVRGELPDLAHVVDHRRRGAGRRADGRASPAAGAGGDDAELDRRAAAVGPDDACLIIYTSGTTGRPEGRRADQQGLRRRPPLGDRDGAVRRGRRRLPLPAAGPRVRPADPGRLRRGRRGDRLLGWRHHADRRRARPGPADRAAVGAAHLREGLRGGHGHGARRAARRTRRRRSPSG